MACAERRPDAGRQAQPAVNRLPRHELPGDGGHDPRPADSLKNRNGILVSQGARPITAETVRRSESDDSGLSELPGDPAVPLHD